MEYKRVQYGSLATIHIKCPKCNLWQFKTDFCECNEELKKYKLDNIKPSEIRIEMPNWRERIPKELKEKVFQRDEYICQYCGIWCYESYLQNSKAVVIDHAIPFSIGGSNDIDNLVTSCRRCNAIKNDKIFNTFEEAREFILQRKKDE